MPESTKENHEDSKSSLSVLWPGIEPNSSRIQVTVLQIWQCPVYVRHVTPDPRESEVD